MGESALHWSKRDIWAKVQFWVCIPVQVPVCVLVTAWVLVRTRKHFHFQMMKGKSLKQGQGSVLDQTRAKGQILMTTKDLFKTHLGYIVVSYLCKCGSVEVWNVGCVGMCVWGVEVVWGNMGELFCTLSPSDRQILVWLLSAFALHF